MNNQNMNGFNNEVNNNVGTNPLSTSTEGSELQSINLSTPQALENIETLDHVNSVPVEPAQQVKPTLDAILNGTSNENLNSANNGVVPNSVEAREIPVGESIPNLNQNSSVISNINETPVVDTSASISNTPLQENSTVQNLNETSQPSVSNVNPFFGRDTIPAAVSNTESVIEPSPVVSPINETTKVEEQPLQMNEEIKDATIGQEKILESGNIDTLEVSENSNPVSPSIEKVPEDNLVTSVPQDDFNKVPVPPVLDDEKKKKQKKEKKVKEPKEKKDKGGSKAILFVLLLILIAAIGFGVYYFLSMTKEKATSISVVTKEVRLELGNNLPQDVAFYATVSGYDQNNCGLDLTNVNIQKVSTYKFSVTCGKVVQEGTIIVDDTVAPKVVANDLVLVPNASLKAADFIESCEDSSSCTYRFAEDIQDKLSKVGEYDIQIIASDSYNNETVVDVKLTISRNAPVRYLTCVSKEQTLETIPASVVHTYRIGITSNDTFFNAVRNTKFTYNTLEDYRDMINQYDASVGINGVVGTASFNESSKTVTIKASKTIEDMNKDLNGRLPSDANILYAYLSGLGYTCN